ncbi:glycosyltransferase family 4 protein [Flagellimonas baculiformis]|uniref:glycosyltransferase family 4 protein n=1 Tax=Flagellimonas baculiformis TaxID=3067310 RepID=UPI00296F1E33|nr:glycosyltransferase family 4 protein [Muricauda sp. D6]
MKLLYITNQISGSGGLERVLSIKASHFADELGHEVHIVTLNDTHDSIFFKFSPKIQLHNISLRNSTIAYMLGYFKGVKKIISDIDPDIILVCDDGIKGFFVPFFNNGKTIVYERHVSKVVEQGEGKGSFSKRISTKIKYKLMDIGAKKFDSFIVLTEGNRKEWKSPNVRVIANPLPIFPEGVSALTEKKVIAVGKHCYQKGYDRLLMAWEVVTKQHPDWTLEIFGLSHPKHNLDQWSKNLRIDHTVNLKSPAKDIYNHYLNSSFHVLSSRYEGFGMVIIEAMACGLPSISFDCPHGPSDIITDHHNGLLVENGNIEEMANSICKLIEDENLRKRLGHNAKISVGRYKIREIGNVWNNLFLELANRH